MMPLSLSIASALNRVLRLYNYNTHVLLSRKRRKKKLNLTSHILQCCVKLESIIIQIIAAIFKKHFLIKCYYVCLVLEMLPGLLHL